MNRSTSQAILVMLAGFLILFGGPTACRPHTQAAPDHRVGIYVPPSGLTLASVFIDPANSTGCAADLPGSGAPNWGTSATCTGSNGPLLSWWGLANGYWGCTNVAACYPRLRQNTTVTFLSSQTGNLDPVYATPSLENGAWLAIVGNLGTNQTLTTTTLSSVTAKNRATPQLLQAAFAGTALDGGTYTPSGGTGLSTQLVFNSTHPSYAWIDAQVSGSTYSVSQPIAPITTGSIPTIASISEVDTWANGDAVTVYQPVSVDLVRVSPYAVEYGTNQYASQVYVENLFDVGPLGTNACSGLDVTTAGRGVLFVNVSNCRAIHLTDVGQSLPLNQLANSASFSGAINSYNVSGIFGGYAPGYEAAPIIFGGIAVIGPMTVSGSYVDLDTIVRANKTSAYQTGNVYVASGKTFTFTGSAAVAGIGGRQFWGAGTVNAAQDCRVTYPAGASQAAATFVGVTLNTNSQTKTCLDVPSSAAAFATCNVTLSAANLDSNLGATSGCLVGAGAAFCNTP